MPNDHIPQANEDTHATPFGIGWRAKKASLLDPQVLSELECPYLPNEDVPSSIIDLWSLMAERPNYVCSDATFENFCRQAGVRWSELQLCFAEYADGRIKKGALFVGSTQVRKGADPEWVGASTKVAVILHGDANVRINTPHRPNLEHADAVDLLVEAFQSSHPESPVHWSASSRASTARARQPERGILDTYAYRPDAIGGNDWNTHVISPLLGKGAMLDLVIEFVDKDDGATLRSHFEGAPRNTKGSWLSHERRDDKYVLELLDEDLDQQAILERLGHPLASLRSVGRRQYSGQRYVGVELQRSRLENDRLDAKIASLMSLVAISSISHLLWVDTTPKGADAALLAGSNWWSELLRIDSSWRALSGEMAVKTATHRFYEPFGSLEPYKPSLNGSKAATPHSSDPWSEALGTGLAGNGWAFLAPHSGVLGTHTIRKSPNTGLWETIEDSMNLLAGHVTSPFRVNDYDLGPVPMSTMLLQNGRLVPRQIHPVLQPFVDSTMEGQNLLGYAEVTGP